MRSFRRGNTYHINNLRCKFCHDITVSLSKLDNSFDIVDGGTDTHVLGNTWKPLYPIDDTTPRVDIIGFYSNAAYKKGFPIGSCATKKSTD